MTAPLGATRPSASKRQSPPSPAAPVEQIYKFAFFC
jgi:hypothetical protein